MERKVIALAGNTLVVSLPMNWVKEHGIRKGDAVEVEISASRMEIRAKGFARAKVKDISLAIPLEGASYRILGALYKAGYDEVEMRSSIPANISELIEVGRREFVGFEITKKDSERIGLRSVSKIDPDSFEKMLRRAFLLALEIAEDGKKSLEEKNQSDLRKLMELDHEVNKYADFCRRVINTVGYHSAGQYGPLYYVVEELEKISDAFTDVLRLGIDNPYPNGRRFEEMHAACIRQARTFYELYYGFSIEKLKKLLEGHKELCEGIDLLLQKSNQNESLYLSRLKVAESTIWNTVGSIMILRL